MFFSSEYLLPNMNLKEHQSSIAFMASMPIGMIHQLMFISSSELDRNRNYQHLRWSSTYDNYSINFILLKNPEIKDYDQFEKLYLPNTISVNGLSIQIMLIYNH